MPDPTRKHTDNGAPTPTSNGNGFVDPLAEAEALKELVGEFQARLNRLIATLKHFKKQSRAVRAAVQSLQELPPLVP